MESIFDVERKLDTIDREMVNMLFGTTDVISDSFILDKQKGLGKLYEAYKNTGVAKVLYIHGASVALMDYFDTSKRRSEILGIIKTFAEQVKKIMSDGGYNIIQRTHYMYAIGYIYNIKADLVSLMDIDCRECEKLEARQPGVNEIIQNVNSCIDINVQYTWLLYRINAMFMVGCEEVDSAVQLYDLLYSWFGVDYDLEQKYLIMTIGNLDIPDPYKELEGFDSIDSYFIKYYYIKNNEHESLDSMDPLKEVINTIELSCTGIFTDIAQHMWVYGCLIEESIDKEDYDSANIYRDMLNDFIDSITDSDSPVGNLFIRAAEICGLPYEEYKELADDYINTYNNVIV